MENGQDDVVEQTLSENLDQRLRLNHTRNNTSQPLMPQQQQAEHQDLTDEAPTKSSNQRQPQQVEYKLKNEIKNEESEDDSDFDSDFEDDFDDPALEAFRQRRLAEMKQAQQKDAENKAKGHGDYRTISQDEFLSECTGSDYVAVHFFHKDFERCKIMDHHLKIVASIHLSCKFVRIDAEKTPFFVAKLNIKTLPTLIMFKDGKTMDRLTGFEGLSNSKNPDEFSTSSLGRWLEKTGAIEYEGPDSDDEDTGRNVRSRNGMLQSRFQAYDADI